MKLLFFFYILFFYDTVLEATSIKIASYNVENLFDMVDNGQEYDEYKPNKHNWTRTIQRTKLLNISDVICDINADIIGLQEVENEEVLKSLQKTLHSVGCTYAYSAITHKKKSAIQVALLSKIPIQYANEIVVNPKLSYRNILEVKCIVDGLPLIIYVNHWSSKRSAESTRMLSARVLTKRLQSLPQEIPYIVLGDFNSDYNEYEHMEVKHNDMHGQTGINHLLKTTLNDEMIREKNMKSLGFKHYNLWLELPMFQRWSHNFFGNKQALDAILLPPSLFDGKGIEYVNNSFKVHKPSYLFHKKGFIYRWQYRYERHLGQGYSDHLPIVAHFSTKPYCFESKNSSIKEGKIANLYQSTLDNDVYLKKIYVILKRGHHAIIKQSQAGRAIFVYGAKGLEEGKSYDILVHQIKNYKGLQEIVDFSIEYRYKNSQDLNYYCAEKSNLERKVLQNEVLKDVIGIYQNKKFYLQGRGYPIFFKKADIKPKDGLKLKLHRVQIGYYDTMQLVVWDAKDFTILE